MGNNFYNGQGYGWQVKQTGGMRVVDQEVFSLTVCLSYIGKGFLFTLIIITMESKVDLSTPTHETEKIPDFILLKESRKEVGQLKAEIDYLTVENDKLKERIKVLESIQSLDKKNVTAIKREEMYANLKKQFSSAQVKIHELRKNNTELICQIVQLRKING